MLQAHPVASSPVVVSIDLTDFMFWRASGTNVLVLRHDTATGKEQAVLWDVQSNSLTKVRAWRVILYPGGVGWGGGWGM